MSRLRRRQLAALTVGAVIGVMSSLAPSGAAPGDSRPPRIGFEDIVIDPPAFSPNGDSRKDDVDIRYRLLDSTRVTVTVHQRDSSAVVFTLKNGATVDLPGTTFFLQWGGTSTGGELAPDGEYTISFHGVTVSEGDTLENERIVRIDTRVPVISSFTMTPPVDTTRVAASPNVQFRTLVNDAGAGDSLLIAVAAKTATGRDREVIEQQQLLLGSGTYPAECDSCFDRVKFPDGKHRVRVRVADVAGNVSTFIDSLDRDVIGPRPTISYPILTGGAVVVQHADSLVGSTSDRHGVARIELRIGAPLDTTIVLPQTTSGSGALRFVTQLGFLDDAEAQYPMVVRARDPHGVADSVAFTYTVDHTAPPVPRLTPRPGPISKSSLLQVHLAVDPAQTTRILRTGGAAGADTSSVNGQATVTLSVPLSPNVNHLAFRGLDRASNISAAETLTVVYETSFGLVVPERFHAGQRIEVATGDTPGTGVEVRVYATDGSTVRIFEDHTSKSVYSFPWDLKTVDGNRVKNGAYLVRADLQVSGTSKRQQKLIAVLE